MEPFKGVEIEERALDDKLKRSRGRLKLAFAIFLAVVAGFIAYYQLFRTHPAQSTVENVFLLVEEGNLDGAMKEANPDGQLGILWYENREGARDTLTDIMDRYRMEFSSLGFDTRVEGDLAEVELTGGRVIMYVRDEDGPPAATFDLGGSDLAFYLEKKEGHWLIQSVNYDLLDILSGEGGVLPF
ncbi:MAG: hypothetical protein SWK76_05830 [Actinomycetota bacterium]|nr:hypothetical protein [Actinomycetota bacterium]